LKGEQNKHRNQATLQQSFFVGKMITKQQWQLERAKALGVPVLGFAVFSLYLILANWLYTLNFANLPLGAAVNNFIMPLVAVDIAFVNLYVVYRRRRPPSP